MLLMLCALFQLAKNECASKRKEEELAIATNEVMPQSIFKGALSRTFFGFFSKITTKYFQPCRNAPRT